MTNKHPQQSKTSKSKRRSKKQKVRNKISKNGNRTPNTTRLPNQPAGHTRLSNSIITTQSQPQPQPNPSIRRRRGQTGKQQQQQQPTLKPTKTSIPDIASAPGPTNNPTRGIPLHPTARARRSGPGVGDAGFPYFLSLSPSASASAPSEGAGRCRGRGRRKRKRGTYIPHRALIATPTPTPGAE